MEYISTIIICTRGAYDRFLDYWYCFSFTDYFGTVGRTIRAKNVARTGWEDIPLYPSARSVIADIAAAKPYFLTFLFY